MSRAVWAWIALLAGIVAVATGVFSFVDEFPRGLAVFACIFLALGAAWYGVLRKGVPRWTAAILGLGLLAVAVIVLVGGENGWILIVMLAAFALGVAGARRAFKPDRSLPPVPPPRNPVLFVNPRSGDGRAADVGLVEAARERGLETIELEPCEDLEELVRAAVGRGADGLAMAGGDGSQALVAAIAAEHDLPYACIPSGTRNHFALDLGVDREDVVGALAALEPGAGERLVDIAEVNGRVFVNNVSLGVYAEAVSRDEYREAKLRTLLETLSQTLGPEGDPAELRWLDDDGAPQTSTALILVSNNPYRLGPTLGTGTRPRLDSGTLGMVDFHPPVAGSSEPARYREMAVGELEIECDSPIPVGIDGESATLESPLRFRVRTKALRVRIAPDHPGASPSAEVPRGLLSALGALIRIATGSQSS